MTAQSERYLHTTLGNRKSVDAPPLPRATARGIYRLGSRSNMVRLVMAAD
jgi:hypothetical protein